MNRAENILNMIKQREQTAPTLDDIIEQEFSHDDIMHYLHTEQDPRRMAKWCRMYLELDY